MKTKRHLYFPILLKVIFLGIITSFIASTVAIVVNYNNMLNNEINRLDESANDALEYANGFFDDEYQDYDKFNALNYIKDYVMNGYNASDLARNAKLEDYNSFLDYEEVFASVFVYFYPSGMFMTRDYLEFRENYNIVQQIVSNTSFYSEQSAYFALKDPNDANRLIFFSDSRNETSKFKNVYYHCPGSHYDIKEKDKIVDIGHSYIQGYSLSKYYTRFIEIKGTNPDTGAKEVLAYLFVEYSVDRVPVQIQKTLVSEILILLASSMAVIIVYAILSYIMFVKNINKLNKVAIGISEQLGQNKQFDVIDANIKSHDEMKTLGTSIEAMEHQLVDYVEIIRADAREKEKINAELEIASKIQLESLPNSKYDDEKVSLRAFIRPAKEVGGDFYDYFTVNDNKLAIVISDVSGKGIPASLFMMKSKELLKSQLIRGASLVEAVRETNEILNQNNTESLFVTSFIGLIDFKKGEIEFVSAGHERPYIISQNKVIKLDGESNFVLGCVPGIVYKSEKHPFEKGDKIFLFTDGLNESINDKEEEFSYARIEETLSNSMNENLDNVIKKMKQELANFVGDQEAFDDVTMLIVRANEDTKTFSYDKKDVSIIEETINAFEDNFGYLPNDKKSKVGIVLDELMNNLISYEKREDLHIDVTISTKKAEICVEIASNGDDYDPFKNNEEKYYSEFSEDMSEGGFGISIVQEIATSTEYKYENGRSITTIKL